MTPPQPPSDQFSALCEHARHIVIPDGIVATNWPIVKAVGDRVGMAFDDWQADLGKLILALDADGNYASAVGLNTISICRQAGKTYLVGGIVFALSLVRPGLLTVWTAHHSATTNETFQNLDALAELPGIKPFMLPSMYAVGRQGLRFRNGSRILFGSRTRGFGRGIAGIGIIVADEAQIMVPSWADSVLPSANTISDTLVVLMGTPPKPGDPSEYFTWKRRQALAGKLDRGLYVELSADPGADPDDRTQWAKANPSYPARTGDIAILRLKQNLSPAGFRREALGIWDEQASADQAIPPAPGTPCHTDNPPMNGIRSYGVKFSADGNLVALAVALNAGRDRPVYVEGLEHRSMTGGIAWLVDWLAARKTGTAQIVIDGRAGAGMLAARLADAGVRSNIVILPTVEQVTTAHAMILDAITTGQLQHWSQPGLDEQVAHAGRRPIGNRGGWGWLPINGATDTAILDAVTLAYWAARTTKRVPGRTQTASI